MRPAAPTSAPAAAEERPAAEATSAPEPTQTEEKAAEGEATQTAAGARATEAPAAAAPGTTATELPAEVLTRIPPTPTAAATVAPEATLAPAPSDTSVPPTEVPTELPPTATSIPPTEPPPTAIPTVARTVAPTALPEPTRTVQPTVAPEAEEPTPVPVTPTTAPAALPAVEDRLVELEWPSAMRLGESDVIRLSFMPSQEGYTVTAEFPEHQAVTRTVAVKRPPSYDVFAVARLDHTGFDLSPEEEQAQELPPAEPVIWRWSLTPRSTGQHRLAVSLKLRWAPQAGATGSQRESIVYSRALDIQVSSFLGLTPSQATTAGMAGVVLGGGMSAFAVLYRRRATRAITAKPNRALAIEPLPGMTLSPGEDELLRTLFRRYSRITVQYEFRSGYSGARTLLVLPVREDGRADAHTIAKLGERDAIEREFDNYERYVKNTLPPITARIQEPPAATPNNPLAVVRYTFIGEPGHSPTSLREALLANPDPVLLTKLFETFGPNWWMQRRPYSFRLAQEYDRVLPTHAVIEPAAGKGRPVSGQRTPAEVNLAVGDVVTLRDFARAERRPDGASYALTGHAQPGQPPLRVRWMGPALREGNTGRVVATRQTLLREFAAGLDLLGMPDPLDRLPALLMESVAGTQSTIHGDLNLENVLIGPGGMVWLIDFAQTRDGHTLFDFAHLEAEIIAHVIAPRVADPNAYLEGLKRGGHPLTNAVHDMAQRCLFNAANAREYQLARWMACLGALKFTNLDAHQKQLLYLTAAFAARSL